MTVQRPPHTNDAIERIRASQRRHWADPDARARHGELTKRRMNHPGVKERISERTKAAMADPAKRALHRAAIADAMASPVVRNRISQRTREAMRDPSVRQRIREGMARARDLRTELQLLRLVWDGLSNEARAAFLRETAFLSPNLDEAAHA